MKDSLDQYLKDVEDHINDDNYQEYCARFINELDEVGTLIDEREFIKYQKRFYQILLKGRFIIFP